MSQQVEEKAETYVVVSANYNYETIAQKNRISALSSKVGKYGWYTTEFGSAQAPKENMNIQKWEMVIFHIYSIKRLLNGEIISEIFKKSSRGVETIEWFWVADLSGTDGLGRSIRGLRQARASKFSLKLKGQRFSLFLVIANSSAKVKLLDP